MAAIYIDNLIKPREINSPSSYPSKETVQNKFVYTDLKLDLKEAKNLGNGLNPAISNDIEASYDLEAIRNSLYNIFTTRKGQKVLNPLFGGSLDQHLFENITEFKAKILGDSIVESVSRFENRVRVDSVQVMPMYDENQYYVIFNYTILNIKDIKKFEILFNANNITFI